MKIKTWIICLLICAGVVATPFHPSFANENLNETEYCDKAEEMLREGKFEEALVYYDRAIAINPYYAHAYWRKGVTFFGLAKYEEAIACYDKSLSLKEAGDTFFCKSEALSRLNRLEEAEESLVKAVEIYDAYKVFAQRDSNLKKIVATERFQQATKEILIKVNGKELMIDTKPIVRNGRTFAPLRAVFEALGAKVEWIEESQTIIGTTPSLEVVLQINGKVATVNGSLIDLDAEPFIKSDRTMVPVRFIAESLGASVQWNDMTKTAYINTPSANSKYSDEQIEWALAINAIIAKANNWKLNAVGGGVLAEVRINYAKKSLSEAWGTTSRETALSTIQKLKNEGHRKQYEKYAALVSKALEKNDTNLLEEMEKTRTSKFALNHYKELDKKSLIAWDYCRIVFVANQSYNAGYLSYDEAVDEIMNAAKVVQSTYSSWEDLGGLGKKLYAWRGILVRRGVL